MALGVTPGLGLDPADVARRAGEAGANELRAVERESVLGMLRDSATEPFVPMLAPAGALAELVGEVRDGLLVLAGLSPIVGAEVITEFRGERALEALRAASAPVARVRRGGTEAEVPAAGVADRHSVAYGDTSVVGGRGKGIVVAIGQATEVGRVAGGVAGRPEAAIPVVPALDDAFRATPLDAGDWALVLCVAPAPAVVARALRVTGRAAVA